MKPPMQNSNKLKAERFLIKLQLEQYGSGGKQNYK